MRREVTGPRGSLRLSPPLPPPSLNDRTAPRRVNRSWESGYSCGVSAEPRRPWKAVLLALLCAGLGHLYAGRPAVAVALQGVALAFGLAFARGAARRVRRDRNGRRRGARLLGRPGAARGADRAPLCGAAADAVLQAPGPERLLRGDLGPVRGRRPRRARPGRAHRVRPVRRDDPDGLDRRLPRGRVRKALAAPGNGRGPRRADGVPAPRPAAEARRGRRWRYG